MFSSTVSNSRGIIVFLFNYSQCKELRWEWVKAVVKPLDRWGKLDSPVTASTSASNACSTTGTSWNPPPVVPYTQNVTLQLQNLGLSGDDLELGIKERKKTWSFQMWYMDTEKQSANALAESSAVARSVLVHVFAFRTKWCAANKPCSH